MSIFKKNKKKVTTDIYWNGNPEDVQGAYLHLLNVTLHNHFQTKDIVEEDCIYLPDWQMRIAPEIQELNEQSAVLGFYIHHPNWGPFLYECCAGTGQDSKTALATSAASFLFGFMQGVAKVFAMENSCSFEINFVDKPHRFKIYLSDIVCMGEEAQIEGIDIYWKLLEDDIKKRMGNQRFCYVKIYASKINKEIIGECRINDIQSDELSAKVAEFIKNWPVENFASQKQFFFIEQDKDTIQPYPYWGEQGEKVFIDKMLKAVQLFHNCETQESFDTLYERLVTELEDATLATECRYFLPEICAEHIGEQHQVKFSETIDIMYPNEEKITLYKHQLADYYSLQNNLFTAFEQGIFGDETNEIYKELIGSSAICSVLEQMLQSGSNLENCQLTSLTFQTDEHFEIR